MSLPEAVQIIRGMKGTKITLALLREGNDKPIILDVERQNIDVPSVVLTYEGANKDVAYIKLSKFGAETKSEWDSAVVDFVSKTNVKGVVLDLRNNPGGYLQAAADIATDFFEQGTLVVSEEAGGQIKEQVKTTERGRLIGEKTIVLINKGSASASEILSGALRDQKGYKLLGETSFGKGTVQEPQQFPDGTGIHITIRKWLTPKGTWVHGKGLEPDIKVEDDTKTPADEQLQAAIKYIEQ
jgi:carboxyl-terminal processing protease